jgi:hypothetical protein
MSEKIRRYKKYKRKWLKRKERERKRRMMMFG